MVAQPKRMVLIGIDGANMEAMKPLLERDLLPNFARLLQGGTFCENAYAPYPTLTGSNWASIATGAWPGTHGVTDMSYHVTGEPIDYWHSGFTSDAVEAETLWEALARVGKKSIVLKYTGSWPPRHPEITMIDGGGGRPFWGGSILALSHSQLFSSEEFPNGTQVQVGPATEWASLPESKLPPLQFLIEYRPESGRVPEFLQFEGEKPRLGDPVPFWGIIFAGQNAGYDTVALCTQKDWHAALAVLGTGQWSKPLQMDFQIEGESHRGDLSILLDSLDPETGAFALFFPQLYPTDAFTQPAQLGTELVDSLPYTFELRPSLALE